MFVNNVEVQKGLDQLKEGIGVFDATFNLVYCNKLFKFLRNYPDSVCVVGASLESLIRYNADRGDFGPGSPVGQTAERMSEITNTDFRELKREMADGKILKIRYVHLDGGGLTVTFEDVSEEYLSEQALKISEERYALVSRASSDGLYDW
ncbi:MAG: PAS-domain containing protein, partial [Sneathiella sp.]|nr:PAS-domain containing protein [Sneathiella sp.]